MITVIGTILIVLGTVGIGLLIDRKWGITPRKQRLIEGGRRTLPAHAPGEAPATALDVGAAELERLRRRPCDECRGETDALADDTVAFDGRSLLVIHACCRRCARTRALYVCAR